MARPDDLREPQTASDFTIRILNRRLLFRRSQISFTLSLSDVWRAFLLFVFMPFLKTGLTLFLFSLFFKHKFYIKNCRLLRDLNLDRRSRRRTRWPLDHYHGHSCVLLSAVYICAFCWERCLGKGGQMFTKNRLLCLTQYLDNFIGSKWPRLICVTRCSMHTFVSHLLLLLLCDDHVTKRQLTS